MSDEIYCGIGKVPKGKRLGTMKECVEANQVRLYGIYKVDKKLLEHWESEKKRKTTTSGKLESKRETVAEQIMKLKVHIKKKMTELNDLTPKERKANGKILEKDLDILNEKLDQLKAEYNALNKAVSTSRKN